jgi:hypothetical protein
MNNVLNNPLLIFRAVANGVGRMVTNRKAARLGRGSA